jgi:hypothetical protein
MPYPVYKLIHFLGLIMVVGALVAAAMHGLRGGTKADDQYRKSTRVVHGIGMFLLVLGGFGLLARIGVMHGGFPMWVNVKLVLWLLFGAAIALPYRGRGPARAVLIALPLIVLAAAASALYKPFTP